MHNFEISYHMLDVGKRALQRAYFANDYIRKAQYKRQCKFTGAFRGEKANDSPDQLLFLTNRKRCSKKRNWPQAEIRNSFLSTFWAIPKSCPDQDKHLFHEFSVNVNT